VRQDFGEPNTILDSRFSKLSREEHRARQYFKVARAGSGKWQAPVPSFWLPHMSYVLGDQQLTAFHLSYTMPTGEAILV